MPGRPSRPAPAGAAGTALRSFPGRARLPLRRSRLGVEVRALLLRARRVRLQRRLDVREPRARAEQLVLGDPDELLAPPPGRPWQERLVAEARGGGDPAALARGSLGFAR